MFRWNQGQGLWFPSICKHCWCCHWIYNCCICQYGVSNYLLQPTRLISIFLIIDDLPLDIQPTRLISIFLIIDGFLILRAFDLINRAVKRSNCFHQNGKEDPCLVSSNVYMIMFGVVQILFSQIPDFDQISWLSIVAAIMSFTYSTIGLTLGIVQVIGKH
jgi:uncharacterized membrane protein